jgi:bacteriocin-like protein
MNQPPSAADKFTEGDRSTPKRGGDNMRKKHEIADQPSPAVRKEQECELTETELNRVSGGGKVGGCINTRIAGEICVEYHY